ncbi:MAG: hypothetical protein HOP29_10470 [Phycisphaerales bacterium]|nr:hypothetical protein [Phycisphaerales bacterium]
MTMIGHEIRDALKREPFEPFRVVTSSGESYIVRDPQAVAIMKTRVFVALPNDGWTFVPYLHVSAVESVPNGKPRRRRK